MEQFNIYIGLLKKDMKTKLNSKFVLKTISDTLLNINVLGFNVLNVKGFWNGKPEEALKVSFVNTFEISEESLKGAIEKMRDGLKQESILLEVEQVNASFI